MPNKPIALKDINVTDFEKLDYYQRLGINPTVENIDEEVKSAFCTRVMLYYPDKNPNEKAKAETVFKAIVEAYDTLSDLAKRHDYQPKKQETTISQDLKVLPEEKASSVLFHFENKPANSTSSFKSLKGPSIEKGPEIFEISSNPAITTISDAEREKCKDIMMMVLCAFYCIPYNILTCVSGQACAAAPVVECGAERGWEGYRGNGAPKKGLTAACCRLFCAPCSNYEHSDIDRKKQNAFIQAPATQTMR